VKPRLWLLCAALFFSACGSDPQEVQPHSGEQKVVSLDLLGILHKDFPCEKYLEEMRDATEINIGYLAGGTFGESRECLNSIVTNERTNNIRVHTCSGPCVTNSRCHASECFSGLKWGDSDQMLSRIESFGRTEFSTLSNVAKKRIYASPVLEHQLDRETFDRAAELLLRIAGEYGLDIEIVDNPLIPRPSKWLLEVHNFYAPSQFPYIFSTDGYFGFEVESMLDANRDAVINFRWDPAMNGLCTDGSDWVYPTERRCW